MSSKLTYTSIEKRPHINRISTKGDRGSLAASNPQVFQSIQSNSSPCSRKISEQEMRFFVGIQVGTQSSPLVSHTQLPESHQDLLLPTLTVTGFTKALPAKF
ncbi:hypothetical protein ACOSQ2_017421 [Xanthoceras sorbifolium]